MNSVGGADIDAFAAQLTLKRIYRSHKTAERYGSVGTGSDTLAASDAGRLTLLYGHRPLLGVGTGHPHPHATRSAWTSDDDTTRTGRLAGRTPGAEFVVDDSQPGLGVDAQGAKRTCIHAIAASQTPVRASSVAASHGSHGRTRAGTVVEGHPRPTRPDTRTFKHGHTTHCPGGIKPYNRRYPLHGLLARPGA